MLIEGAARSVLKHMRAARWELNTRLLRVAVAEDGMSTVEYSIASQSSPIIR